MKTPSWFLKKSLVAYLLLPLSIIYLIVSKIIFHIRTRCSYESKIPVICIGNIFAGGVGKTPIVREIATYLNAPVVMRGYKGGDEAKMLKKAGLDVYTGNRKENIKTISDLHTNKAIVMDDGFQNPTIKKDISILVFDENIGVGNGFILPAGPLREPVSAIRRADAVIVVTRQSTIDNQFIAMLKKYNKPVFYATNKTVLPASFIRRSVPFIAFSGIGYPQKFFDALDPKPVKTFSYPDHYQYTESDLIKLKKMADSMHAQMITTEKDWIRLPSKYRKQIQFAKLETAIESKFWKWLRKELSCKK